MSQRSNLRQRFNHFWSGLHYGQRRRLVLGVVLAGVLLGSGLGYLALRPTIDHWRHKQALEQASRFAEEKNYRDMLLALQRATLIAPGDVDTWKRVAEALESLGRADALVARENIVMLAPNDPEARLMLATEALRFDKPQVAQEALQQLQDPKVRKADFHRLSAELARSLGDVKGFEEHLDALVEIEPDNAEAQLKQAVVRLHGPDPIRQLAALAKLEALVSNPKVRLRAALLLLEQAAETRSQERAGAVVRLLLTHLPNQGNASGNDTNWTRLLGALKESASQGSDTDLSLLTRWFGRVRLGAEALKWLETLPEQRRAAPPVREAMAEIAARIGDNSSLRRLLETGAWGNISQDTITLALAAHLQFLASAETRSRETWNDAIASANRSLSAYAALARLAQIWRETIPAEAALRALITEQPKAFWAYAALKESYTTRGDAVRLLGLYEAWQDNALDPAPQVNTWVRLGCILDRVSPKMETRLAALLASDPTPSLRVSQAALLWRKRNFREALNILSLLPENERKAPEASYWLALVQCDLSNRDAAAAAITHIAPPEKLLDDEILLLQATSTKARVQVPPAWKNAVLRRTQAASDESR